MAAGTTALIGLLGGAKQLDLALALHVRDYTYALSLGRPVWMKALYPTGDDRGPLGRAGRHVRAVAFSSDAPADWGEQLPPWSMAEIGPDAQVELLSLN